LLVQAAKQMVSQGRGGRIINTSRRRGLLGNLRRTMAASSIHALTRIVDGTREQRYHCNALAPNAYTRMTRELPGMKSSSEAEMGPQFMAPLVCYLASDQAANITGQTFGESESLFVYKMLVSEGVNKLSANPWDPEQIGAVIQRAITW
jgi:NAD(P)-dependent dehydrogenase (short-subunit alcohol dehydrogenase family)